MSIKDKIKYNRTVVCLRMALDSMKELLQVSRYIGSTRQFDDPVKLGKDLEIRLHSLEKGMSIGNARPGFGCSKALDIIADLKHYLAIGGEKRFADEAAGLLELYCDFNVALGGDVDAVRAKLRKLVDKECLTPDKSDCGLKEITEAEMNAARSAPFDIFSQSRHSVRSFGDHPIDIKQIESAIEICRHTPSACNRQNWRIHVFTDEKLRNRLFDLQKGSRGFSDKMQAAILVCSDLRGYGFYEQHLPYVDGGIYAMNLLYALHYEGLAAIPLTMSVKRKEIDRIRRAMHLPANEAPVILIGVGSCKPEYKVAVSHRVPTAGYVTFNK